MTRILLTGMSGAGKSTVLRALGTRGWPTADADFGWCVTSTEGEWVWDEPRMDELLEAHRTSDLVVAGCASNQGRFRDRFDVVILLSAPLDLLLARVRSRTDNPYGSTEADVAAIRADCAEVEPLLRASADHEVRTDRSIDDVIVEVVGLIEAQAPPER